MLLLKYFLTVKFLGNNQEIIVAFWTHKIVFLFGLKNLNSSGTKTLIIKL